jgi:hypothetical protein
MNRSLLLLAPLLISGCDFQAKHPSKSDGNVMIDADHSGQVSFNFPFAKGSVKLPESMINNGKMVINDVPMIPGGKMTSFHLDTANKANVVTMDFTAPQSPHEVRAYFTDKFKEKGVETALNGDTLTGTSEDGDTFAIKVGPAASGSAGRIEVQDKDED